MCSEVQKVMVRDGIPEAIGRIIFVELKEFRDYKINRENMRLQKLRKMTSHGQRTQRIISSKKRNDNKTVDAPHEVQELISPKRKVEITPEDETLRIGLSILNHLASHPGNRDALVEKGVCRKLLADKNIYDSKDRKLRRPVGKILNWISDTNGEPHERHHKLFDDGILVAVTTFLTGDDYELKAVATKIISCLTLSKVGEQKDWK